MLGNSVTNIAAGVLFCVWVNTFLGWLKTKFSFHVVHHRLLPKVFEIMQSFVTTPLHPPPPIPRPGGGGG